MAGCCRAWHGDPAGSPGRLDGAASTARPGLDTPRLSRSNVLLPDDHNCARYLAGMEAGTAGHQIACGEYSAADVVRNDDGDHICTADCRGAHASHELRPGDT